MEPKICRREVRAASGPVHHLTPSPTSHDSVTKRLLEEVHFASSLFRDLLEVGGGALTRPQV